MTNKKTLLYILSAFIITASSCKSCKKNATSDAAKPESSVYDDSLFAGLDDTTANKGKQKTAAENSTAASASSSNKTTSASTDNATIATNAASSGDVINGASSTGKKKVAEVESESASKNVSHHRRGGSASIYDGVNDQEERYVVRKAEGYNDAYYVDDYNGSNKFYEDHYKKASKLEKPAAEYIDKSINLPSNSYAKGPTQKSVDAVKPPPAIEEPVKVVEKVKGGTGSIGISKKELEAKMHPEKPKNAQEMLKKN